MELKLIIPILLLFASLTLIFSFVLFSYNKKYSDISNNSIFSPKSLKIVSTIYPFIISKRFYIILLYAYLLALFIYKFFFSLIASFFSV